MNRRRILCKPIIVAASLAVALAMPANARAIEVETVVWGFDGKVVANEFNPMSVLVFNPTAEPFDGQLQLRKSLHDGEKGAPLVEPVFVSPFARRWVQFYPFIQSEQEEWSISWQPGRGRDRQSYRPTHAAPAHVLMESPGSLGRGSRLWAFNEELFPPFVSATAGLASVALDHQPRWPEKARQEAFLDWLYAGGSVHLLHDSSGEFPTFTGALSVLNAPVEKVRIGAGIVYRHPRNRSQLDRQFVEQKIHGLDASKPDADAQPVEQTVDDEYGYNYGGQMLFYAINQSFLSGMKGMTRADHNWLVIHLMSFVYIFLVFPGCWLIGRKWRDYRITLGMLLACIALFSLGFRQIGRRGYGEATAVHSIAIARPLSGGRYDVISWTNLFVTDGDVYVISHQGAGRMYSTAQENERVRGTIKNGAGGGFGVDIPPFSSREFVARWVSEPAADADPGSPGLPLVHNAADATPGGEATPVTVASWEEANGRLNVALNTGAGFPDQPEQMLALHKQRMYRVARTGGQLTIASPIGELSQYLAGANMHQHRNFNPFFGEEERPKEQVFRSMLEPLVARQLRVVAQRDAQTFSLADDRLRLFVYASLPPEFHTVRLVDDAPRQFERQEGRVLYCFDVFDPNR